MLAELGAPGATPAGVPRPQASELARLIEGEAEVFAVLLSAAG